MPDSIPSISHLEYDKLYHILFIIHQLRDIELFHVCIMNNVAMNIMYEFLCRLYIVFLLGIYLDVGTES